MSSCCSKTPGAGWLINNRNLLPTVLEAGSLRSAAAWSGEGLPGCRFLSCPHMVGGTRELSEASLKRALIPLMWALLS